MAEEKKGKRLFYGWYMVGAGAARRYRHVRWQGVAGILGAWALTVPACALLGAALLGGWRVVAG